MSRLFRPAIFLVCALLGAYFVLRRLRFTLRGRVSFGSGKTSIEADMTVSLMRWSRRFAYHLQRSAILEELAALLTSRDSPGSGLDVPSRAELLRIIWGFLRTSAADGGLRSVEMLVWLGTGDAATTAIASGLLNGLLGGLAGVWSSSRTFPQHIRTICTPVWRDAPVWRIELDCILASTLSQAIRAAWRAYRLVRARKGQSAATQAAAQEKGRRYARASHSGVNENGYVNHQGDG